ncbi:peptidase C14 caspase catalytic subunit p20 [Rhodomicrobium vannielii ATCC 17100]|uniref:Peptidase C14 caspase catalytic subunit p20 n=1 Tax=Rhodomicrobium vannielii (strain ATCC 17100 / DSM 162 / LMG 4299 / NCIMB 10020 / ATH 3.1.1) TaxID=648757 RepID=E3I556_RHOVT|nr:caspase family protein [Rhodomicrobium vannielii]ADP70506.1 peptidase C14 caspase catalytic subunit p20 [Rhodomicrobium vannielii ATCC 17100]
MGTLRVDHLLSRFFILALLFIGPASAAFAEKRVALLVGVDAYDNLEPLKKAVGDARAIRDLLTEQGDVEIAAFLTNPSRNEFWNAWQGFLTRLREGDEAIVAISSHGIEIEGNNYLLARDAPPSGAGQRVIQQNAIRFGDLMEDLAAKNPRVALVILDACRDNPYRARGERSLGGERGLGRIDPPRGTFVLYSAGASETALDRLAETDPEPTSVYIRNLLPLLKTQGSKIQDVAVAVRGKVSDLAYRQMRHQQNPAYYDNLKGSAPYCFAGCAAPAKPQAAAPVPLPAPQASLAPEEPSERGTERVAPSFNCNGVNLNSVELKICHVAQLARLDLEMQRVYDNLLRASKSNVTAFNTLVSDQRQWLKLRSMCGPSENCIDAVYKRRLEELNERFSVSLPNETERVAPSFNCNDANLNLAEIKVCQVDQLSRLDIEMQKLYDNLIQDLRSNVSAFKLLVSEQRQWLKLRSMCGANELCLTDTYKRRLQQLKYRLG